VSARPSAWLSLGSQENDPIRFFAYLLAALQTYDPYLGSAAQALLRPLRPPSLVSRFDLEMVLTLLLNDLQDRTTDDQNHVILVLDDYHVITDETIHCALSFLLDHLPPQLHLVLSTRQDPPLPLARLRGRDAVLELRAADLQFMPQESSSYLVEVMGLSLSAQQRELLHARTEGWITGLQLAAHSLQAHADSAGFITAFSGCHRYVVDYLLEEVLHQQPADVQDFLLHTCILERLCGPLCDAMRATSGSQAMLDILEQANLFLLPLDEERHWYRYHSLFAQVLRQRLQQTRPSLIPALHRRASCWYEQHGFFAEAVSHALAAPAFEVAVRLIEQCTERFILENQVQTLCDWLGALPESLVLVHPALGLTYAIALIYTNQWEMASAHLQTIEQSRSQGPDMPGADERVLLGQITAGRSLLAGHAGDLERSVTLAHRAVDLLEDAQMAPLSLLLRLTALLGAAHEYLVSGDVTTAVEDRFTHITTCIRSFNSQLATFRVLTLFARLQMMQGRLRRAAATYAEAVQLGRNPTAEEWRLFVNGPSYSFGLGSLLCEWNDLEGAKAHLTEGMDRLRTHVLEADEVWLGYAALVRLLLARGRDDQALATLDSFLQLAHDRHIAPVLLAQAIAMKAHVELARGNLALALHWAATSGLSVNDRLSYPREREYLTLARVRIAEAREDSASSCLSEVLVLLGRLLVDAQAKGRMQSVLEILLLRTLALEVQGNRRGALAVLSHVLDYAEPEGYVRLFLDEGPPMMALLHQTKREGITQGYSARLLAVWNELRAEQGDAGSIKAAPTHLQAPHSSRDGLQRSPSAPLRASSLTEPLTCREREVLRLLLDGASNREIACHLVLSVNTVKKHVLNICGKLNTQSRTQAIVKAQALHLL
jgi:LuxR family transcriptional regulator, maltose regulon positive regulatory protein